MAVTFRANQIKLKTQEGTYTSPVVLGDSTIADHIAQVHAAITTSGGEQLTAIETAGGNQITAIENKGAETLESIPEDYTELDTKIDNLQSDLYDAIEDFAVSTQEAVDHWLDEHPVVIEEDKSDIAIVVDGDRASDVVPVNSFAYIRNNIHGLTNGLYVNTGTGSFPVSGGTADQSQFTVVNNGGLNAIIDIVYPVGSIYMSVTSTSPAVLFGGTWEQLENRFLIGAGTNYASGNTGGSATHTLTTSEMPSHNHTFTGNEVDTGENSVGHTHTYTDYYATTTGGTAISVAQMPSHTHTSKSRYSSNGTERYELIPWSDSGNAWSNKNMVASTGSTNSHTHTGNNTSTTRTSDDVSDNHTHKVTATGTIGNSGSGDAFSIIPPYLAVYMWKRTA